jgi:hypothetical protein
MLSFYSLVEKGLLQGLEGLFLVVDQQCREIMFHFCIHTFLSLSLTSAEGHRTRQNASMTESKMGCREGELSVRRWRPAPAPARRSSRIRTQALRMPVSSVALVSADGVVDGPVEEMSYQAMQFLFLVQLDRGIR